MLINVKMPIIVGILTFVSVINSPPGKKFYNIGACDKVGYAIDFVPCIVCSFFYTMELRKIASESNRWSDF